MKPKLKLVLIAAALLPFIGGGARMAYAAPSADGCSLLTPAQIQKVLGQPFSAPKEGKLIPPFGSKWGSHCTYESRKSGEIYVDFWVYVTASPAQAKQWFDMGAAVTKSKQAIGDSAYIDPSNGYIYVLKGKVYYWISIAPANETQEKDLAASVAARI